MVTAQATVDPSCAVRAEFRDGDEIEYLWIDQLKYEAGDTDIGTFSGVVRDPPQLLNNVRAGTPHTVSEDQIVDWMYVLRDRIVGGYTLKARMEANRRRADEP